MPFSLSVCSSMAWTVAPLAHADGRDGLRASGASPAVRLRAIGANSTPAVGLCTPGAVVCLRARGSATAPTVRLCATGRDVAPTVHLRTTGGDFAVAAPRCTTAAAVTPLSVCLSMSSWPTARCTTNSTVAPHGAGHGLMARPPHHRVRRR
ncbi:hypothetical protein BS78_10G098000 [Paspalum vaginatum]|nr:hypothetical protein BS78_10G098000 [Paspalum vaginatum]